MRCLDPYSQSYEASLPAFAIMRSSREAGWGGWKGREGRKGGRDGKREGGRKEKVNFHMARDIGWRHNLHLSVNNREICSLKIGLWDSKRDPCSRPDSDPGGSLPYCHCSCTFVPDVHTVRAGRCVHIGPCGQCRTGFQGNCCFL